MSQADIGLIGLAVMGENLVLNMESHGFTVAVLQPHHLEGGRLLDGRAKGKKIVGTHSLAELVAALKRPRKVMMMVKAGKAVDDVIEQLLPLLEPGDILIDGGNTHYPDTIRRTGARRAKGLLYIGTGVSGGEEGALKGPSIMPGGSPAAWPHVKPIFQAIAAKVDDGTPCCDWVGENGAGHFVKMVHNGIEYGDMQLICEAYHAEAGWWACRPTRCTRSSREWNKGELDSYLIEITRDILGYKDADGQPLVDLILDTAGQKGTGKWTVVAALDLGVPLTLIAEAVFARCLSALKDERVAASKVLTGPTPQFEGDTQGVRRRRAPGALRHQDHLLRAGLHADARGRRGAQLEAEQRRRRADVARRLHHPLGLPRQDQGGVRPEPRAHATCCSTRSSSDKVLASQDAWRRVVAAAADERHPAAGVHDRALVLRRLPHRAAAGQPAAGPARLLRRPHLRAASTSRAASSSTPTGPAAAAPPGLHLQRLEARYPEQPMTTTTASLDQLCVNTIRALAIDAVQKANSGHPGLPLGAAPVGYSLFTRTLRYNPKNPHWPDRDRFVLSAGHGSALLYSLLHLTGYDLPLDQLKQFRQFGSQTPGHPERGDTAGVETTTGPLGQGFGNARRHGDRRAPPGGALQPARPRDRRPPHLRAGRRRRPDGRHRAGGRVARRPPRPRQARLLLRLEPHLPRGHTNLVFTTTWRSSSRATAGTSRPWPTATTSRRSRARPTRRWPWPIGPSLVIVRTEIGYGSPKQGTFGVHGSPLDAAQVVETKRALGWPRGAVLHCRLKRSRTCARPSSAGARPRRRGRATSRPTARRTPTWRRSSSA